MPGEPLLSARYPLAPTPASTPKDLRVKLEQQRLFVDWQDGHSSEFAMGMLRRLCPCATCRVERAEKSKDTNPLNVLASDPSILRATGAELVGNYAIRLKWSDGHDTGIYDFRFLRSLDSD